MHTYYLGQEQVDGYLRELGDRLTAMKGEVPTVWCPIGRSGEVLVRRLLSLLPELIERTSIVPVSYDRNSDHVTFATETPENDLKGRAVLVIDSSVHSGSTIHRVIQSVERLGPSILCSYTLILKRSAAFIPGIWGVMIGDHDRAYFLLDRLPNNRLNKDAPNVHIRRLAKDDLGRPPVQSTLSSLDRITWGDRFYDMRSSERERRTYLLERGAELLGYLTISLRESKTLFVDEVAVDHRYQKQGHGGALLRWAETCARQLECDNIQLWAIQKNIETYRHNGFSVIPDQEMCLGDETYFLMTRKLVHHI